MARSKSSKPFGDGGEDYAEGDITLEDLDIEATIELQALFDKINEIDDPVEQKAAMKSLLTEMYPDEVIR